MLVFNLSRVLDVRGIEKPHAFLMRLGFTRQAASSLINDRVSNIKLSYLDTLCIALGCMPNDLFEWRDREGEATTKNHPVKALNRQQSAPRISQIVKDIPLEKFGEVEALLKHLKNE